MLRTIHKAVLAASIAFLLVVVAAGSGDREARARAAKLGPTVSPDVQYLRNVAANGAEKKS